MCRQDHQSQILVLLNWWPETQHKSTSAKRWHWFLKHFLLAECYQKNIVPSVYYCCLEYRWVCRCWCWLWCATLACESATTTARIARKVTCWRIAMRSILHLNLGATGVSQHLPDLKFQDLHGNHFIYFCDPENDFPQSPFSRWRSSVGRNKGLKILVSGVQFPPSPQARNGGAFC